jgi:hypothetical protein
MKKLSFKNPPKDFIFQKEPKWEIIPIGEKVYKSRGDQWLCNGMWISTAIEGSSQVTNAPYRRRKK